MIYALMDECYFFSFIFNKLMIMHDFINKLVVTLFIIFSLQDNFQIEDLIIKSANSEIRWNKKWQFCGWDSEQMKQNLENTEHGFCPERTQLNLLKNSLPNLTCMERNAGFIEHDFLRFVVVAVSQISAAKPNSPCSCWKIDRTIFSCWSIGWKQSNFLIEIML